MSRAATIGQSLLVWLCLLGVAAAAKPSSKGTAKLSSKGTVKPSSKGTVKPSSKGKAKPSVKGAASPTSQPAGPGPFALPRDLPTKARFVVIPLHEEVSMGMAAFVDRAVQGLASDDILLLDIRTFGGAVVAAVRIRDALLRVRERQARTVAYINPRAISAGALIAYATDVIVVASGATMGAATPIQIKPGGESKAAGEKVVSYMRKEMRATAEARGRNGDIAEAMVDPDVEVAGLIKKGKLLTLDGKAALRWGVASFEADTRRELIKGLGYDGEGRSHSVVEVRWSWAEQVAGWLSSSTVAGLLMTIGMLGLMIGLYSGGSPIPLAVGGICLALFFFGHYVTNLAGLEDMLVFAAGLVLLGVEIFVVPGFGIFGVLGVLCVIGSLFLGLIDLENVPLRIQWHLGWVGSALSTVFGAILATGVLGWLVVRFLPQSRLARPLVLTTSLAAGGEGQAGRAADAPAGVGVRVVSDLRPAGKVEIDGRWVDARAEHGFIPAGTIVEVVRRRGFELVVRPLAAVGSEKTAEAGQDARSTDAEPSEETS